MATTDTAQTTGETKGNGAHAAGNGHSTHTPAEHQESEPTGRSHTDSDPHGHRSIVGLARELVGEMSALVSGEVALARSEIEEKVTQVQRAVGASAIGAGLLAAGLLTLVGAAVTALALVWPLWLSSLVIGGGITIIGAVMIAGGKKKMSAGELKPRTTMHSMQKNRELVHHEREMATEGAR